MPLLKYSLSRRTSPYLSNPHKHIATPHEVLHEGDEVKVKVLEIHPEEHRIALSIKALEEKPASEEEPKNVESYELP